MLTTAIDVDWTCWTVVLLKPDCIAGGLVEPVLTWVGTEVTLVDQRLVTPTEQQIFAHYDDLLTIRRAHFTWVDGGYLIEDGHVWTHGLGEQRSSQVCLDDPGWSCLTCSTRHWSATMTRTVVGLSTRIRRYRERRVR